MESFGQIYLLFLLALIIFLVGGWMAARKCLPDIKHIGEFHMWTPYDSLRVSGILFAILFVPFSIAVVGIWNYFGGYSLIIRYLFLIVVSLGGFWVMTPWYFKRLFSGQSASNLYSALKITRKIFSLYFLTSALIVAGIIPCWAAYIVIFSH